ncbi:hypothetical protein G7B40_007850 [Aetokthonos hydrillicola Thurmond2011]|jgi:hypothetical protein|uniref:Uncharacterized protein n=1 Tax=Aetokthonos hydrillicola Thurmond2011 TaxID=2712845 RepID=A0AAP5M439_9CYAN|nr:hypothetical protein [Aetokthonos hydrillicola]MBO3462158.1 hypothetical protein [Aetokthonos hydrillicola CCALA 1050]MBW4587838.1 hypothetical protein [Aetokthonos hydrillicola CCALA 1050]MDR9894486.1 hypothetical protein [Aetokthonos hydrillicola Thurmond2011]
MGKITNKEIAFILKDAQSRTKTVTSARYDSEINYVLSCYYWQYGSADLAQYADALIEKINKEPLFKFLKSVDSEIPRSLEKGQMLGLVKKLAKTKVRKWLKEEILPEIEMSIALFEAIFSISRSHRRRLQETEGVLPITRWGSNKYGQYPILSMVGVLGFLKAMPETLQDIKLFADKDRAKELARKQSQLNAKPQLEEILNSLDPKYQSVKNDYYLKILITREDYLDAVRQVETLVQDYDKAEVRKANAQAMELRRQQALELQKQEGIANKYKPLSPSNPAVIRLLEWLNKEDMDLFVVTKEAVTYNPKVLNDDSVHEICSLILESKSLGASNQKRWNQRGNTRQEINNFIEELEDAIYSHPLFSPPVEDLLEQGKGNKEAS